MSTQSLIEMARSIWPFDRAPLDIGVESGIVWATVEGPVMGINGYALIPAEGHIWSKGFPPIDELDTFLSVHGGITYAHHPWVGFDTAHFNDYWPSEFDPYLVSQHLISQRATSSFCTPVNHWTPERVAIEASLLAKQIAEINEATNE